MSAWDRKCICKTGSSCETAGKGVKSLPLPRDVEDTAIAAVLRPSVSDVDRSSIGALRREGNGWRFSGPASWGWPSVTLRLSPPPSAVAILWPPPDVSGEHCSQLQLVVDCERLATRTRHWTRRRPSPAPHAIPRGPFQVSKESSNMWPYYPSLCCDERDKHRQWVDDMKARPRA